MRDILTLVPPQVADVIARQRYWRDHATDDRERAWHDACLSVLARRAVRLAMS